VPVPSAVLPPVPSHDIVMAGLDSVRFRFLHSREVLGVYPYAIVMTGLDPVIHAAQPAPNSGFLLLRYPVDARIKSGHDDFKLNRKPREQPLSLNRTAVGQARS
jgi:hypothetical protein